VKFSMTTLPAPAIPWIWPPVIVVSILASLIGVWWRRN